MVASLFGALFGLLFQMVKRLLDGIFRAPMTAVEKLTLPVEVRLGSAAEVIALRHRVLRRDRPRETAIFQGDQEESTRHWVAVRGEAVIGVASVMESPCPDAPNRRWQLRGMAVDPGHRGLGIGKALLAQVQRDVDDALWCNARTSAAGFYEKLGWKPISDDFEIDGIGPHRRLEYSQ